MIGRCDLSRALKVDSFTHVTQITLVVIPAQAGIQSGLNWTPAFAGVTVRKMSHPILPVTIAFFTSAMARVMSMPRGQASTQLNAVRQRHTPIS